MFDGFLGAGFEAVLLEIIGRTLLMFCIILLFIRLSGKRGVRQLSLFEIAIILGLGSAAGDPMFYMDVPIWHAILVFIIIFIFYRALTFLAVKSRISRHLLEGKPLHVIDRGVFLIAEIGKTNFAREDFFIDLRNQSVEHMGQVRTAYVESEGTMSILFFAEDEVQYGLPIFPNALVVEEDLLTAGHYACVYCGRVVVLDVGVHQCAHCACRKWCKAMKTQRLA